MQKTPHILMPKLFGELRNRYLTREGGYTRVVRTEPKNTYDQGESSILEFVDGPKDSRFMMTAKTIARDRLLGRESTPVTAQNIKKVTQFRGEKDLEDMVQRFLALQTSDVAAAEEGYSEEAARIAGEESSRAQELAAEVKTQKKEAKS